MNFKKYVSVRALLNLHAQNEDVMIDKFEVSLCEGMSVAKVIDSLETAERWLISQPGERRF